MNPAHMYVVLPHLISFAGWSPLVRGQPEQFATGPTVWATLLELVELSTCVVCALLKCGVQGDLVCSVLLIVYPMLY